MATSPRNELVVESVIVFGKFPEGWVWAERTPDGSTVIDSSDRGFKTFDAAQLDFFEAYRLDAAVDDPAKAHYSMPIEVGEDEVHIRKYKYGAPDPIQAVV
jgi:hypothetical protein